MLPGSISKPQRRENENREYAVTSLLKYPGSQSSSGPMMRGCPVRSKPCRGEGTELGVVRGHFALPAAPTPASSQGRTPWDPPPRPQPTCSAVVAGGKGVSEPCRRWCWKRRALMTGEVRGLSRPWSERTELRFREICSGWQRRRQGWRGRPGADVDTAQPSRGTWGPQGETWKPKTCLQGHQKTFKIRTTIPKLRGTLRFGGVQALQAREIQSQDPIRRNSEEIQLFQMVNKQLRVPWAQTHPSGLSSPLPRPSRSWAGLPMAM